MNIPLEAGRTIEQVFPNPDEPDHAPDAEPWTIERRIRNGAPERNHFQASIRPNFRDSPPRFDWPSV